MAAFRERRSEMQSEPGDTSQEQPEGTQVRFTAEAALTLLQSFGLDKDDLEELVLYPEEQMTPIMLAEILRKIREEKDQRADLESRRGPRRGVLKPREDEGLARSSLNVGSRSSSLKSRKMLQESKQLRSSKTLSANAAVKAKQSLKSKVSKSALLMKKKPGALKTDGKNSSGKCNKGRSSGTAAKPVKTANKRKQNDQEKHPSISGPPTKRTAVHAEVQQFPTEVPRSLPTPAMIQDYAAETPRVFPHCCCLCSKDSADMMDWFFHQTSSLHLQSCRLLRKRFPEWDGEVRSILREASQARQPRTSWRCEEKRQCRRRSRDSRSRSPSWSPPHPPDSSSSRSRSRSPHLQRGNIARMDRRSGLHRRHDSRDGRSQSLSGSPHHKSSSADRGNSSRRGDEAPPPSRRSRGRRPTSTETPLSSAEKVAKRMLKNSAVQILSQQSDVQTAVRTLAPVLLAELAKMASTSSPSQAETLELAQKVAKKLSKERPVLKKSKKVTAVSRKGATSKKLQFKISVDKKKALKKKVVVKAAGAKQTRTKNPGGTPQIQKKPGEPEEELASASCSVFDADAKATLTKKASPSPAVVTSLTVGERLAENLTLACFNCFDIAELMKESNPTKTKKLLNIKQMFITNLPEYHDGCYTQEELAEVLRPFGFQLGEDNIYVIPQTQIAVVQMADSADLQRAVGASAEGIFFKESRLGLAALSTKINMQPFGFYKTLMKKMSFKVTDDGASTIFIQDISACEVRNLRDALRKIGSVKNFLPLLNKVFVEFESTLDGDRLGIWFGLLKQGFGCRVYRLKTPTSSSTALPPRLPAKALPNNRDIVNRAIVLVTKCDVPEGSTSPFWVSMTTSPFLFPTASAWFIIPNYITVKGTADIQTAGPKGSKFCTIMLTGLPEGNYTFTDITKRVSPYFPKDDDSVASSKVVVLPLQRRGFIFFNDWNMCCTFAEDCIWSPIMVRGCHLNIHFVLEDMHLHSSEVVMYRHLMKWSNGYVSRHECLEKRLLLVEIFQTSVMLIEMVVNVVASIAPFVSFLPLANTIYIEMAEPRGVTEVVNTPSLRSLFTTDVWMKIRCIRPISHKVLSENLQDLHLPSTSCQHKKGTHSTCEALHTSSSEPAASVGSKPRTQSLKRTSTDSSSPHRPSAGPLLTSDRIVQVGQDEMETSDLHSNQDSNQKPEPPAKKTSKVDAGTVQEEEDALLMSDLLKDQPPGAKTQSVHVTMEALPEEDPLKTSEEIFLHQQEEEEVEGYQRGAEDKAPPKDGEAPTTSDCGGREEALREPAENVLDKGASDAPTEKPKEELIKEEDPTGETSPGLHVKVESPAQSDDHVEKVCEDSTRSEQAGLEKRREDLPAAEVRGGPQTLKEEKEEPQWFEVGLAASEDKEDRLNVSRPTKRKLGDDAEETLKPDGVGGTLQKPAGTRPRGRPPKMIRVANVRRSPRGKTESPEAGRREEDGKTEIQKGAEDAGSRPLNGKEKKEVTENPTRSVRVPARSKLQPFNPNCSYGQEFTVPTEVFYCNLCSVFYMRETAEEDLHCCSKLHYDKLWEYCQKRAQLRKCSRKLM